MKAPKPIVTTRPGFGRVIVTIQLYCGSLTDPSGKSGLSYLTAQSLLLGAGNMSRAEFNDRLENLGSSIEISVGHHTTHIEIASLLRNCEETFGLAKAMLDRPAFDEKEIADFIKEASGNHVLRFEDDEFIAERHFNHHLYDGAGYGRPADGVLEEFAGLHAADARRHYKAFFRRALRRIAVCAPFGRDRTLKLGGLMDLSQDGESFLDYVDFSATTGPKLGLVDKPKAVQSFCFCGAGAVEAAHSDFTSLRIAQTIFCGTFTSRLTRRLREEMGLCYQAEGMLTMARRQGAFCFWLNPSIADIGKAVAESLGLLAEFVDKGPTEEELAAAARYLLNRLYFRDSTPEDRAVNTLTRGVLEIRRETREKTAKRICAVSCAEIRKSSAKYLDPNRMVWTIIGSRRTAKDLKKIINGPVSIMPARSL